MEKIARFPGGESAESCHGFSVPLSFVEKREKTHKQNSRKSQESGLSCECVLLFGGSSLTPERMKANPALIPQSNASVRSISVPERCDRIDIRRGHVEDARL